MKKVLSLLMATSIIAFSYSCGNNSGANYYNYQQAPQETSNDLGIPNSPTIKTVEDLDRENSEKDNTTVLEANSLLFGANETAQVSYKEYDTEIYQEPLFMNKIFEPSSLCFDSDGKLYTVADKGFFSIFELEKSSKGINVKSSISIDKMQLLKLRLKKKHKFDFEGIEYNPNDKLFYLSDERDRKVFTVDRAGNINDLGIDVNSYLKANNIKNSAENSGLEGLTLDPKNNKLYLIKEMNESVVITVDLNTKKIIKHFKISLPGRVEPSLTDGSFFDGFLYLLVRSHRLILKVNPETGEILSTYNYRKYEENNKSVYIKIPTIGPNHDKDGYGVMEGLAVTKDFFYIATDNNMIPLKSNILQNHPQLFILNRPDKETLVSK